MIITAETKDALRRGDIICCVNAVSEEKRCVVLAITSEHFYYIHIYDKPAKFVNHKSIVRRNFWSDYTRGKNHVIKTGESLSEEEIRAILDDNCLKTYLDEVPVEFLAAPKLKLDPKQQAFGPWTTTTSLWTL